MAFWRKDDKKKAAAGEDPQAYVARREYDKAIQAYKALLSTDPSAYVYHHKVADVYCLAGKESQSLGDYSKAADGYAKDGFLIKAVAILKKMQKLAPSDASIATRLDALSTSSTSGFKSSSPTASSADESLGGGPEISLDMEEFADDAAIPLSEPDEAQAPESAPAAAGASIPMEMEMEERAEEAGGPVVQTPLFSELQPAELREVVEKLRHHSFPSGATLVKEGDPGDSLFVLCQGKVEVSTHGPKGERLKLAELGEGDFFGEVSLLTGKPRTATISSMEETEVLELTRGDLDELEARHPRVKQVINDFYERRVASTVEAMIQAIRSPKKGS